MINKTFDYSFIIISLILSIFLLIILDESPTEIYINSDIYVIDGDTIKYDDETLRLFGIDTPEYKKKQKDYILEKYKFDEDCLNKYGDNARNFLTKKIQSATDFKIEKKGVGIYGRPLIFLYLNDVNINKEILLNGFGFVYSSNTKDYLKEAEREAKKYKKGVWQCQ
jgi:micrococcal nuclease